MSITYTLEPRDLRAFQRYAQKHLPNLRRARYIIAAWMVALCLWLALSSEDHRFGFRIAYFCVLLLVFWGFIRLATLVVSAIVQWRSYTSDKFKSVLCEHTVTLADDAFIEATRFNEGRNRWSGIYRVVDTPDYIYVFASLHLGHIIPKRAFPDAESARQFYDRAVSLQSRVQPIAS
jgi:YcxB-like protein